MSRRGCHRRGLLRGGARGPDWLDATRRPPPGTRAPPTRPPTVPALRSSPACTPRAPTRRRPRRRRAFETPARRPRRPPAVPPTPAVCRAAAGETSRPCEASRRRSAALPAPSAASAAASESTRTLRSLSSAVSARLSASMDASAGASGARMSASARGAGSVGANRGRSEEPPETNSSERSSLDGRRHGMPGLCAAVLGSTSPPSAHYAHRQRAADRAGIVRRRARPRGDPVSGRTVRRMMHRRGRGGRNRARRFPRRWYRARGRVSRCVRWFSGSRADARRGKGVADSAHRPGRETRLPKQAARDGSVPDFPTSGMLIVFSKSNLLSAVPALRLSPLPLPSSHPVARPPVHLPQYTRTSRPRARTSPPRARRAILRRLRPHAPPFRRTRTRAPDAPRDAKQRRRDAAPPVRGVDPRRADTHDRAGRGGAAAENCRRSGRPGGAPSR